MPRRRLRCRDARAGGSAPADTGRGRRRGPHGGAWSPPVKLLTLRLPARCRRYRPKCSPAPVLQTRAAEVGAVTLRVLLADDHVPTLVGMRWALEHAGMQVVAEVTNGPDAVVAAVRTKPDVALMDVNMPGGCGIEAAAQIVRDVPGTAVVMLSSV